MNNSIIPVIYTYLGIEIKVSLHKRHFRTFTHIQPSLYTQMTPYI